MKVIWTETARKQRKFILKYWINRNKSTTYALKLKDAIKRRTDLLKIHPDLGVATSFA